MNVNRGHGLAGGPRRGDLRTGRGGHRQGHVAFHEGDRNSRSHGCVRLSPDAAAFYEGLRPGDAVQVRR